LRKHASRQKAGWARACLACCLLFVCAQLYADDTADEPAEPGRWTVEKWRLQTSLYTRHWDYDPEHNDDQHLINVEAVFANNWRAGAAAFDNSFGQDSWFVYMGYEWPLFHSKYFYFKLVGGLLYGYKDEYQDKIPLNGLGIAPAIIPILGAQYKWFFTELDIAGTAAITWTAGIQF
jgi:hypothetical protein